MFNHKLRHNVRCDAPRATCNADRFTFHTERYNNLKYKNSPYYKGSELWNTLPITTTNCDNIFEFKSSLRKIYRKFEN